MTFRPGMVVQSSRRLPETVETFQVQDAKFLTCTHQEEPDPHILSRREILGLMGTVVAAALADWGRGWTAPSTAAAAALPACVVRPAQTEGPYFVDEKLNRSDIRSDPSDGSIKPGAPLRLAFQVSRIDGQL